MKYFNRISRYFYVAIALVLGYLVVYGLSMVSEKSKGPIETVLTKAGTTVQEVEKQLFWTREKARVKISWLGSKKLEPIRKINSI